MNDNIRLHKEHGLNPTIPACIICGKDKGEIALLGASYKGEAPAHGMVLDVQPCKKCTEKYLKKGTLLVEAEVQVVKGKENQVPTGRITVIKDEAFANVFNQEVPKGKIVMVEKGILQLLEEQAKRAEA